MPNLWSIVEQNIALICACFPPLAVIFREAKAKVGGTQRSTTNASSTGNSGRSFGSSHKKWFSEIDDSKATVDDEFHKESGSLHGDSIPLNQVKIKQEYTVERLPSNYV